IDIAKLVKRASVAYHFRDSAYSKSDDRLREEHRFYNAQTEALSLRRVKPGVGCLEIIFNRFGRGPHDHVLPNAQFVEERFARSEGTAGENQQPDSISLFHFCDDSQQKINPLRWTEVRHMQHQKFAG